MKFNLPSNGVFGIKSLEMRVPRINDLRRTSELPESEEAAKTEFVRTLLKNPEDVDKITIYDRDYLFMIAVSAVNLNSVEFTIPCSCGTINSGQYDISTKEVRDLIDCESRLTKTIDGVDYTYHILSVGVENEIIEYAESQEDYERAYEEGVVIKTLGRELNAESVKWATEELDLAIYYSALYFVQCMFHGVEPIQLITCTKCGKHTVAVVPMVKSLTSVNVPIIMAKFAEVSNAIDFRSFCEMTIPELTSYTNAKQ